MTSAPASKKLTWKTSNKGNKYLGYYGLRVTVFPNTRTGGWSVSVTVDRSPPTYINCASEVEARVKAEEEFKRLKYSGQIRIPREMTVAERLEGIVSLKQLDRDKAKHYIELKAYSGHETDKAQEFSVLLDSGNMKSFWVPKSQFKDGFQGIIVSKWWWDKQDQWV